VLAGFLGAAALALAIGAGIAIFHVGVEQHWWVGTAECGVTETANSIEALKAKILGTAPVRCDEVAWSLFGISMAGYNALVSLALAAFAFQSAQQMWRERSI
jgi:disulfide bond formation protein DsbB